MNSREDVVVFPEVPAILQRYKALGWRIAGVSNQGGIALGIMTMEDCAIAMQETHEQCEYVFDKIAWCRHHPDAADPEMSTCWCRKPRPGLIIEVAHSLADRYPREMYPPHLALMVGDRPEDKAAAEGAGVAFLDAAEWRAGAHVAELEAKKR